MKNTFKTIVRILLVLCCSQTWGALPARPALSEPEWPNVDGGESIILPTIKLNATNMPLRNAAKFIPSAQGKLIEQAVKKSEVTPPKNFVAETDLTHSGELCPCGCQKNTLDEVTNYRADYQQNPTIGQKLETVRCPNCNKVSHACCMTTLAINHLLNLALEYPNLELGELKIPLKKKQRFFIIEFYAFPDLPIFKRILEFGLQHISPLEWPCCKKKMNKHETSELLYWARMYWGNGSYDKQLNMLGFNTDLTRASLVS